MRRELLDEDRTHAWRHRLGGARRLRALGVICSASALLACDPRAKGSAPEPDASAGQLDAPDADEVARTPPEATVLRVPAWEVKVGEAYDPSTRSFSLCRAGDAVYQPSAEVRVSGPLVDSSADAILSALVGISNSTLVTLDVVPSFVEFAELAAVQPKSTSFVASWAPNEGALLLDGASEPVDPGSECAGKVARLVVVGVRYFYGMRLRFEDQRDLDAFHLRSGVDTFAQRINGRVRLDELEEELAGKGSIEVFALQYGGLVDSLDAIIAESSCSVRDLDGCADLLDELGAYAVSVSDSVQPAPSADDLGGLVPVTARLTDAW